ncbi:minor tail protein [Gordonia phage Lucky10]|uniref:Minor tail protein n=1 Tax=Gordonia phage Lucky10 TaxID=1821557 RepID=A0A142KAY5_9CAUD|nr:minor tail protein [Gordonia phage Lucky10]AMS03268.1 hypothetical protein SEA_LUCKY10_25 [Gordonia phage Lucky10]
MTTPNIPWGTSPGDLPQGVVAPSQLGGATQDHTKAKYRSQAASRFPGQVNDTMAGNPANTSGPLGMIVNLAAGLQENVANADPATIEKPSDLLPQANPFFSGLPLQKVFQAPLRILANLIGGIPIIGDAVEDALAKFFRDTNEKATDAIETAVSVGTQVNYVQQVIALQSGMGVHETGPDRTGTPSFNYGYMNLPTSTISISGGAHEHNLTGNTGYETAGGTNHRHTLNGSLAGASSSGSDHSHTATISTSPPTIAVTATYAPWANVIFKTAAERKVLTWFAYKTGTVSTFNLDVYKLEGDGSSSLVYSSPNLAGEVPVSLASIGWMQHLMSGASIIADFGDVYDVQFRMTGAGTVHIGGLNFSNPTPLPGFRPYAIGSARNPSTTPAPATISTTTRDTMYVGPAPFVSIGIDVGQTQIPRFFFDDFNRSSLGPRWITYGSIGIVDNKVRHTGSIFSNSTAAAMYHQPLATDIAEVGFDIDLDNLEAGAGMCCTSGLGAGVWLAVENDGVWIQTGGYSSRTNRTPTIAAPGAGRYTLRCIRSDDDTHYVFQAYFGDPNATDPILTWPDTSNTIPHGVGRRWVGVIARRVDIAPSSRLDNFTAADVTITEES